MYLVFYLQACIVLVSANSFYEFNCCPNTYSSYGNDQPLVVQKNNYNPYLLSLLGPNSLNPITNLQSIPHQYQSLNTNNFLPNNQFYNQNGLEILHHVPETETEKVINNYILIPQEYFHNNEIENKRGEKRREDKKNENKINTKNKSKRRKPNKSPKISNSNDKISKADTKMTKLKEGREETKSATSRRNKVNKNIKNKGNLLTDIVEKLPFKNVEKYEESKIKHTNNHLVCSCDNHLKEENLSPPNKANYQQLKQEKELTKKEIVKDYVTDVNINSKKKDDTGFADINVCFDINEECTDLNCRHTRNKDVNKKNILQSPKPQQDLPNYMNGLTYNQQMNPNFFNPNVNFPFNFDYLYQTPQTSNTKPKESNNRRRNKKRKPPSSNRQTISNKKNKNLRTTLSICDKIVELTPEVLKIETTTEVAKTTTNNVEPETTKVVQDEITQEKYQEANPENPILTPETLLTEVFHNDDISNNDAIPFLKDNDVIDEYYPDFTLDNTYITSKEDYDFGNFHDRYYYAYGDKPELNRDRRKYDLPNDNNLNCHSKFNKNNQNKNTLEESSQIKEIICKAGTSKEKEKILTPSILEFPGFKTEMINKEKYFARDLSNDYYINAISTDEKCSSKQAKGKQNRNNNVEMVFANSKVVRYGAPEKEDEEVISQAPEPEIKKEFKNLISNDGKTTVVIAKSLDYLY